MYEISDLGLAFLSLNGNISEVSELWELTDEQEDKMLFPKMGYLREARESTVESIVSMSQRYKKSIVADEPFRMRANLLHEINIQIEQVKMIDELFEIHSYNWA